MDRRGGGGEGGEGKSGTIARANARPAASTARARKGGGKGARGSVPAVDAQRARGRLRRGEGVVSGSGKCI